MNGEEVWIGEDGCLHVCGGKVGLVGVVEGGCGGRWVWWKVGVVEGGCGGRWVWWKVGVVEGGWGEGWVC